MWKATMCGVSLPSIHSLVGAVFRSKWIKKKRWIYRTDFSLAETKSIKSVELSGFRTKKKTSASYWNIFSINEQQSKYKHIWGWGVRLGYVFLGRDPSYPFGFIGWRPKCLRVGERVDERCDGYYFIQVSEEIRAKNNKTRSKKD